MLEQAQTQLGPQGRDLQVVFISVDPQRDTPAQVRAYVTGTTMPRNTVGLTGTPEQVAVAVTGFWPLANSSKILAITDGILKVLDLDAP